MADESAEAQAATAALAKKLRLTPATHLLALNAPEGYVAALRAWGASISVAPKAADDAYDAAHSFVREQAQVAAALGVAVAALRPGGALWLMWPKQSSGMTTDLTRDSLAALTLAQGWGPVSNVSIDATWSALRLRPDAQVKRNGDHKAWQA